MGKRELVAFSSWCPVMVELLLLTVPWVCLRFVIVVFLDHTHYFWLASKINFIVKEENFIDYSIMESAIQLYGLTLQWLKSFWFLVTVHKGKNYCDFQ